jgi:hypothetical protein
MVIKFYKYQQRISKKHNMNNVPQSFFQTNKSFSKSNFRLEPNFSGPKKLENRKSIFNPLSNLGLAHPHFFENFLWS